MNCYTGNLSIESVHTKTATGYTQLS